MNQNGRIAQQPPRGWLRDPAFPRDSSERSIIFPIKEESSRLATSSPFSKRPSGQEPSRVGLLLPPTRAPLLKTSTGSAGPPSSSRTLTHVHRAVSVPVEQEEEPTLPDGPAMTPPPPVRSTGRYGAKMRKNRISHQRRSSLELPAPPGAVKAASCDFSPKSEGNTMRETVG